MKNAKSLLSIVLAVLMVASMIVVPVSAADVDVWDGTTDTSWYSAGATEFTLTSAEQLAGLAEIVNGGETFQNKTVKLDVDVQLQSAVDMANFDNWATSAPANVWTCIGAYNIATFRGTFDGQGHTISGMYAPKAADPGAGTRSALFGYSYGYTTIKNLNMTKCYAQNTACTAILVAFCAEGVPTIENVTISESAVYGGSDGTAFFVGKTGGFSEFNFINCDVSGYIKASKYAGAMTGFISGGNNKTINVVDCSADVTVDNTSASAYSGGLFGTIGRGSASTIGTINVSGGSYKINITGGRDFGGLFGYLNAKSIGDIIFDGVTVDATVDSTSFATSTNYQGIGLFIGYIANNTEGTNSVTVKDTNVSGTLYVGQNSGVVIGRATHTIGSINIQNVVSDVDFNLKKGAGNTQCVGFAIGLGQGVITDVIVNGYTSTNTYTVTDTNGNASTADMVGSGTVTNVVISDADMDVTFVNVKDSTGAILGSVTNDSISISDSTIKTNISASGSALGGIIGNCKSKEITVTGSTVDATINGSTGVGGILGQVANNVAINIEDSEINADVTGEKAGAIAGSIGFVGSAITIDNVEVNVQTTGKALVGYTNDEGGAVVEIVATDLTVNTNAEDYGATITEPEIGEGTDCTCTKSEWTAWTVDKAMVCKPGQQSEGHSYRTCKKCGAKQEKKIAIEHLWSVWNTSCALDTDGDNKVNATRVCAGCQTVETNTTAVDAVHAHTSWTTSTVAGETEFLICLDCGKTLDTRIGTIIEGGTVVTPTYTDIAGHKYEADIKFVTECGLFNGMGNGKFEPETTMTRGMIVTVLARLANVNVMSYKNTFTDVADDSYYAPYVGWAEAAKITNGYGDGTFRPNDEITKEQAIAMIARYLEYIGNNDTTSANKADFTDLNTGSEWAKTVVAELIRLGIVENDATTLRPTAKATRAELANYFANAVNYLK